MSRDCFCCNSDNFYYKRGILLPCFNEMKKSSFKLSFLWIFFVLSFLLGISSSNCPSPSINDSVDPSKEPIGGDDLDCIIAPLDAYLDIDAEGGNVGNWVEVVSDYSNKDIEGDSFENWVEVVSDFDDISIDMADIEAWEVDDTDEVQIDVDTDINSNSDSEISDEYSVNDISNDEVNPTSVSLFLLLIICVLFLCSYLLLGSKKKS